MCLKRLFSVTIFVYLLTLGQLYPHPDDEAQADETTAAKADETTAAKEPQADETTAAKADETTTAKEAAAAAESNATETTTEAAAAAESNATETTTEAAAAAESNATESADAGSSSVTLTIALDAEPPENAMTNKDGSPLKTTIEHDIPLKQGVIWKLFTEDWITYHTQAKTIPGCLCVTRGPLPKFKLIGNIHFPKIKVTPERYVTMPTEPTPTICPPCNCPACPSNYE